MSTLEDIRVEIEKVLKENIINEPAIFDIEVQGEAIIINNIQRNVTVNCTYEELLDKLHVALFPFIGKEISQ